MRDERSITAVLISVGFLREKIKLYHSQSVLNSQAGGRHDAPQTGQTGRLRISRLDLSSILHLHLVLVTLLEQVGGQKGPNTFGETYRSFYTGRVPAFTPKFLEAPHGDRLVC